MTQILIVEKEINLEYIGRTSTLSNEVYSLTKSDKEHIKTINSIKEYLENKGIDFQIKKDYQIDKSCVPSFKYVISVGGDSTALKTMGLLNTKQKFLGIKSTNSSHGALTRYCLNSFRTGIERLLEDNEKYETYWDRLSVKVDGKKLKHLAVNEVYIGRDKPYEVLHSTLNGKEFTSSGLIVSTSQGSTAFYKNSGGIPFEKGIGYSVLIPIVLGNGLQKSKNYGQNKILEVLVRREGNIISFDCNKDKEVPVPQGSKISIQIDKDNRIKIIK